MPKKQSGGQPLAALVALLIVIALAVKGWDWIGGIIDPSSESDGTAASSSSGAVPGAPNPPVAGYDENVAARHYPGDGAPKPAIANWMGTWAARSGLPRELPVMAALAETNLRNAPDGDRDSLGYFQMRTSVWLGRYPDFPHRPARQLAWFIATALKVRARLGGRVAGHPSQWGEWVAEVERPEERYRGRYQARLSEARQLLG